tara:strand:+ start:5473 stop:6657 length:1185 start_codon:yes stop_codon:yes gene_type:complete
MRALLLLEHRFKRNINTGKIYASSNSISIELWQRYLNVFNKLSVLARIEDVNESIEDKYLVEHKDVKFVCIPFYIGPKGFLTKILSIRKVLKNCIHKDMCYILRLPSISGTILSKMLYNRKIPFVVELVGDPWEVFDSGAFQSTLVTFHKYRSTYLLKNRVKKASGVIYVTSKTLQKKYPVASGIPTVSASNVILLKEHISESAKIFAKNPEFEEVKLISVGSLSQLYKSPDLAIRAIQILRKEGFKVVLKWLGDGKYLDEMKKLVQELNLTNHIHFTGNIPKEKVMNELADSDLYIHPSRTEGLPRAVIEAMALGLPCIASNVGGIHELLQDNTLLPEISSHSLASLIKHFITDANKMNAAAAANLIMVKEYEHSKLNQRRQKIYKHLLNLTK